MADPIRVLLVDDETLVRTGFRMILNAQPDITVVGEADDGVSGVAAARELVPDVVLMDIRMPRLDGVDATAQLATNAPDVRILVLSTFDLDDYVLAALRAGASGFLPKDITPEELVTAVRTVHSGDAVVAPRLLTRLIDTFIHTHRPPQPPSLAVLGNLTEREREVLRLVAQGHTNLEITEALGLRLSTVKNHVNNLFAKIGARDRAQAVITAYETGLVQRAHSPARGLEYAAVPPADGPPRSG
jgi:DNA-binding NarL/FixJ family response regulator